MLPSILKRDTWRNHFHSFMESNHTLFIDRLSKNLWYNRAWDPRHMDMLGEDEDDGDA
ncbi:hypothetical protein Bca4012_006242 [Brassica carinata]|uniref:Uncharacterized protein n=1 Tax=Brassica carinata TaxID=52824 RepID=A0A8X7RR85_BRACI|nr:hypothetical protein Bca52824_039540 [Brassica carinata]